jgi:hypothetical protein
LRQHTEQMQGNGLFWVGLQYLPIEVLGVGETAPVVVSHRQGQCLLDSHALGF